MFSTNSDHIDIEAVIASLHTGDSSAMEPLWVSYSNNIARHAIAVSRHFQLSLMTMLTEEAGFSGLRLSFEPVIAALARRRALIQQCDTKLYDFRPSELANQLGVSKQICNQTINQLETLDYVHRIADPRDGRARLLCLTNSGFRLALEGQNGIQKVAADYANLLTATQSSKAQSQSLMTFIKHLNTLVKGLGLLAAEHAQLSPNDQMLGVLLPQLSHYFSQRLLTLTQLAGHHSITVAHGQVLALIGLDGGAIQSMANTQNISKQAISVTANDLEKLGYLSRSSQITANAKKVLFNFTEQGWQLMADSMSAISTIENEFIEILGAKAFKQFQQVFKTLYFGLKLEAELLVNNKPGVNTSPNNLAELVKQHYSPEQVSELIRQLTK
tara:strand:+ start:49 stop:1206 length:1158 start_codon:yes stop_codon:yes gene_type:complete